MDYFIEINNFLKDKLKLLAHPDKIILRKLRWGIDFVGYIALPQYSLPRKTTVKRIFKSLSQKTIEEPKLVHASLQSYPGYLKHVQAYKLSKRLISVADRVQILQKR